MEMTYLGPNYAGANLSLATVKIVVQFYRYFDFFL